MSDSIIGATTKYLAYRQNALRIASILQFVEASKEDASLPDVIHFQLSPQEFMDALTGKRSYTWVDLRDFPLDADLSEVAPFLNAAFRAAFAWPGEVYFPVCGEISRLPPAISWRDAKAKLYASSATVEYITTQAHVDEA
ncbi:hypothetical protein CF319_g7603 [Tilletia indica]|nr:hypothetical protein CF319_g7603 [Tilletia indica]